MLTSKNRLDFGGDLNHVTLGLDLQLAWQRFALSLPLLSSLSAVKVKVKVRTLDIALFVNDHLRSAQVWHVFSRDLTVFTCTPIRSIRNRNEPYVPLPSQLQVKSRMV